MSGTASAWVDEEYPCPCQRPQLGLKCIIYVLLCNPDRGRILAAFTAAYLQTHLASRQEKRVIITLCICPTVGVS